MTSKVFLLVTALSLLGCAMGENKASRRLLGLDSLVSRQSALLDERGFALEKNAAVNDKRQTTTLTPDSLGWSNELSVFRQLEVIERPSFRDHYVITETEDTNSNLRVLSLMADTSTVPVSYIRYYYLKTRSNVHRIEARYLETNPLYVSTRYLVLEFEESNGQRLIHRYSVEGYQKIMLADSVHFSITGTAAF